MMLRSTLVFAALAVAAMTLAQGGAQAVAGPFNNLDGSWSGSGHLTMKSGSRERLRCRASNSVGQDGDNLTLNIRCASDGYKFDLSGYMINNNGSISGKWSETNYNSAGTITGRVSGNSVNALAIGNTFSARLSLSGGSNSMSISLRPDDTEIRQVLLSLRKR